MTDALTSLAEKFGPYVAAVAFFIWWAYVRERRLVESLERTTDKHEEDGKECRKVLIELVKANNEAIMLLRHSVEKLESTLADRPCIVKQ